MTYRHTVYRSGPHPYYSSGLSMNRQLDNKLNDTTSLGNLDEITEIPLPNEPETTPVTAGVKYRSKNPFSLNMLKNRINAEEIILIGIIVLLLNEGVNDEFLLIMLMYILLF